MTPLPKRRHSSQRGGKRERAIKQHIASIEKCPKCGAFKKPHRACPKCGFYRDNQILNPKIPKTPKK